MGGSYCVTSLSDAGSGDNVFIELIAAAGVMIGVYKINLNLVAAAVDTATARIRVFRETTAGSGMIAGTVVIMDPTSTPAASTTCNVKQAGVFAGSGTTTDTLMDTAIHLRQSFEWIARDKDDYLWSNVGGRLIFRLVNLNSGGNHVYSVYFREDG